MANESDPIIGNWYAHLDKGQTFRVVAVDEDRGLIEIQHFDGDLEEIETSVWPDMALEPAEEPEDWTGPVDDVEIDDVGYTETSMTREDWRRAAEDSRAPAPEEWQDAEPEDERDDWAEGAPAETRVRPDLLEETPGQESQPAEGESTAGGTD